MPDNTKSPPEPSMEEIIASISRIITEDKKPADPAWPVGAAAPADPVPAEREIGTEQKLDLGPERIVSTATSGAAAAAFAQLGALPRERRREAELPLGGPDRTLEDIVRDMLRPLLETWLNEHLPGIVERLVRQEIARVVGEAGLR